MLFSEIQKFAKIKISNLRYDLNHGIYFSQQKHSALTGLLIVESILLSVHKR